MFMSPYPIPLSQRESNGPLNTSTDVTAHWRRGRVEEFGAVGAVHSAAPGRPRLGVLRHWAMPATPMAQAVAATASQGNELTFTNPQAATRRMVAEVTAPVQFRRCHWSNDARYTFPHSLHR